MLYKREDPPPLVRNLLIGNRGITAKWPPRPYCTRVDRTGFLERCGGLAMNVGTRVLLGAWLLASLGNPLCAQGGSTRTQTTKKKAAAAATASDPDYKIRPQDVLRVE